MDTNAGASEQINGRRSKVAPPLLLGLPGRMGIRPHLPGLREAFPAALSGLPGDTPQWKHLTPFLFLV